MLYVHQTLFVQFELTPLFRFAKKSIFEANLTEQLKKEDNREITLLCLCLIMRIMRRKKGMMMVITEG